MPLPPMKLEPIQITLPPRSQRQSSNATPSRIPAPSSALSTRSGSSSTTTPTKIINYASSEDENSATRSTRRSKPSITMKGSYSTTTLPPDQRRSLKTSSASSSPKSSPKPSPKSSPRMKHSRSTSSSMVSSSGVSASPLSSSLPASSHHHLQRKLSRNGKTPTEPVPKLPTDVKPAVAALNRTTSLHSTHGQTKGSKDTSVRKGKTFSLFIDRKG